MASTLPPAPARNPILNPNSNPNSNPSPSSNSKHKKRDRDRPTERLKPTGSGTGTGAERLKTVVRRLPPNLPEEIFWQSVGEWVSEETAVWKTYHHGKLKPGLNKENISSRAYIAFKTPDMVTQFAKAFDGHVFKDKAGTESVAVVEFAPYQKVPNEKKKPDARIGTIEKDEDYISFIESLNVATEPVTLEQLIAANQPVPQPKTTPLLDALKAERERIKEKEIIVRSIQQPPKKDKDLKKQPPVAPIPKPEPKKAGKQPQGKKAQAVPNPPATAPVPQPGPGPNTRPPKAPRAMRQQQPPAQVQPTQIIPPKSQAPPQSQPQIIPPAAGPTTRRGRPILGLGSRQFEAALSGVGRKDKGVAREDSPQTPTHTNAPEPGPSGSPKKEKKVPSILKRETVEEGGGGEGTSGISPAPLPARGGGPRGGGGGRRGRGRGRGAGGGAGAGAPGPNVPAGGG